MDDSALTGPVLGVTRSLTGRSWQWRAGDARIGLGIAQRLELPEMLGSAYSPRAALAWMKRRIFWSRSCAR
jgi:single-stranded-DNA-specific exonuclease